MLPPVFVLVHTQMAENIGAAARAMKNFALQEMRLVEPRLKMWPHPQAEALAAGADDLLSAARTYPTTADAVADMHRVFATTARPRDMQKPVYTPAEAMALMRAAARAGQRSAILFGPERTGLVNEDVVRADAIIAIPTNPAFDSLNIAQAAVVMAYSWMLEITNAAALSASPLLASSQADDDANAPSAALRTAFSEVLAATNSKHPPATRAEVDGMLTQLEQALDASGFFKTAAQKPVMWQNLQNMFLRTPLSVQEVRTLRGMIRSFTHPHGAAEQ